ncbi:hypothetical protein N0V86_004715 [Didymella sp. IMI 355093]|nr:hypothetical protein N0V86_004715 [Didymella sp. IMI 355093]
MPTNPGSLEDVEAWAGHEFPAYFAALPNFPLSSPVDTIRFDGECTDGKIVLQTILISALHVGVTVAGTSVYARITGCNDVELFCDQRVKPSEDAKELWCIKPILGLDGIELTAPFSYCAQTGHPACIDRLETLIRYAYLKSGEEEAVRSKLGFFKAHFRGACRDVARGTGASAEADEMEDDDTPPVYSPPDLIKDAESGRLSDNPAATSVFNEHVHAMDESYHDFKTTMLRQLGAMQIIDREAMVQLQAQNQHFARRLAAAEEGQTKMAKELELQQAKTKTALEEAERWKTQYEGLKTTLQGALG